MKLLLIPLLLIGFLAQAAEVPLTNVIYGNVGDIGIAPTPDANVTATLLAPNPKLINNIQVRQDPKTAYCDTNGTYGFTNLQWGYYSAQISGDPGTFFNFNVWTNSTGSIAIGSLITNSSALPPDPGTNYYTKAQVDALVISGGGGGGTNTVTNALTTNADGTVTYALAFTNSNSTFVGTFVGNVVGNANSSTLAAEATIADAVKNPLTNTLVSQAQIPGLSSQLRFTNSSGQISMVGPNTGPPVDGLSFYATNSSSANALTSIMDLISAWPGGSALGLTLNYGSFNGSGAGLTLIPAGQLTGTVPAASLPYPAQGGSSVLTNFALGIFPAAVTSTNANVATNDSTGRLIASLQVTNAVLSLLSAVNDSNALAYINRNGIQNQAAKQAVYGQVASANAFGIYSNLVANVIFRDEFKPTNHFDFFGNPFTTTNEKYTNGFFCTLTNGFAMGGFGLTNYTLVVTIDRRVFIPSAPNFGNSSPTLASAAMGYFFGFENTNTGSGNFVGYGEHYRLQILQKNKLAWPYATNINAVPALSKLGMGSASDDFYTAQKSVYTLSYLNGTNYAWVNTLPVYQAGITAITSPVVSTDLLQSITFGLGTTNYLFPIWNGDPQYHTNGSIVVESIQLYNIGCSPVVNTNVMLGGYKVAQWVDWQLPYSFCLGDSIMAPANNIDITLANYSSYTNDFFEQLNSYTPANPNWMNLAQGGSSLASSLTNSATSQPFPITAISLLPQVEMGIPITVFNDEGRNEQQTNAVQNESTNSQWLTQLATPIKVLGNVTWVQIETQPLALTNMSYSGLPATTNFNNNLAMWNLTVRSNPVVNRTFSFTPTMTTNNMAIGAGLSADGVHPYTNNQAFYSLARLYLGMKTDYAKQQFEGAIIGDASQATNLNASSLASGTVPLAVENPLVPTNGVNGLQVSNNAPMTALFQSSSNTYVGIAVQNLSHGTNASGEVEWISDIGNLTNYLGAIGINSSTMTNTAIPPSGQLLWYFVAFGNYTNYAANASNTVNMYFATAQTNTAMRWSVGNGLTYDNMYLSNNGLTLLTGSYSGLASLTNDGTMDTRTNGLASLKNVTTLIAAQATSGTVPIGLVTNGVIGIYTNIPASGVTNFTTVGGANTRMLETNFISDAVGTFPVTGVSTNGSLMVFGNQTNNVNLSVLGVLTVPSFGITVAGVNVATISGAATAGYVMVNSAGSVGINADSTLRINSGVVSSTGVMIASNGFASNGGSHIPAAVTVGASPFSFTNNTISALEVYFTDAAAYTVAKNGVTIYTLATTSSYLILQPTNNMTVTYLSTTPTINTNQL